MPKSPDSTQPTAALQVWDPFVRLFHWTLAIGFFVAYLSEDSLLLHVWAGYLVGTLVLARIVWGFVGPQHARFSDFAYPPKAIIAYLVDLVRFKAMRHLGHSPAGAAMVWVLLIGVLAIVGSGLVLYALEEDAGPLAGFVSHDQPGPGAQPFALIAPAQADEDGYPEDEHGEYAERGGVGQGGREHAEGGEHEGGEEFWEEVHEVLANLILFMVFLHIAGVVFASIVTRENLPRSMVDGRKRPLDQ
jgi:cytochrome b